LVCAGCHSIAVDWTPLFSIASYFGDLGDGIHKGDENDPRVAAIEVIPNEVRYWLATSGTISRSVQEIAAAAQGTVTIPGELRTITKEEVSHRCKLFP